MMERMRVGVIGDGFGAFRLSSPKRQQTIPSRHPPGSMRLRTMLAAALVPMAAGCADSRSANDRDTMTQRQRDSVFGASAVPNAAGVTKAMTAADSVAAQRRRIDSAAADTSR